MLLSNLGVQAFAAYDAETALLIAEIVAPSVVMLDLAMPGYDGLRLIRALRELPAMKQALIMVVSGYGTKEYRQRALEAGCDHFFVKPVDDWAQVLYLIQQEANKNRPERMSGVVVV
jgi:CheY-like chemotaxis protein